MIHKEPIAFMHVPKTAGSTINTYFKDRLGSSSDKKILMVNEMIIDFEKLDYEKYNLDNVYYMCGHFGFDLFTPIRDLTDEQFKVLFYGSDDQIKYNYKMKH